MRPSLAAIAAAALTAAAATPAAHAQTIQSNLWVTNGPVYALAAMGNTLYLGGDFSRMSPPTGGYLALDNTTGAIAGPNPSVAGNVTVSIPDGSGGRFIGGDFTYVQGQPHTSVAHLDANGNVTSWNPGTINAGITALAIDYASPGVLYMAGYFSLVNGTQIIHLAAVDVATGALTGWAPTADGPVYALGALQGVVYIGGSFGYIMGQPRNNLAAVSAGGSLTSWDPNVNGHVSCIVPFAPPPPLQYQITIFVGGQFTSIDSQPRYSIASIDGSGALTAWSPNSDHDVKCIALNYTRKGFVESVFAGGTFDQIGAQPRPHLARLDPSTGTALAWTPEPDGPVNSIALDGSTLYVGGAFDNIGNASHHCLASVDITTGVAASWDPDPNDAVNTVGVGTGVVYAGGNYTGLGGVLRSSLAAVNTSTGLPTAWNPGTDGKVFALAASGSTLYVGGYFTSLGGQLRQNIGAIDAGGSATGWAPEADGPVKALTIVGGTVFAGGSFYWIGGKAPRDLAALDAVADPATSWGTSMDGNMVNALACDGHLLYVGGDFTDILLQPKYNLAAVSVGVEAPNSWTPQVGGGGLARVFSVAAGGGVILAGGDFTNIGFTARYDLAAFDEATGALLTWDPSTLGPVYALLSSGNPCFVGGAFTQLGGVPRSCLAAVDVKSQSVLPWDPGAQGLVEALALVGTTPYAGGHFMGMGGWPHGHLAGILGTVTGIDDATRAPVRSLQLSANPSRGPLGLRFVMPAAASAEAEVFDTNGRLVWRIDGGILGAGDHQLTWDGRDRAGKLAAPGVYFVRVRAGALEQSARAVRLR